MPVKLGMNGFGRIGRYLLRLLADDQDLQIAAVNARADNAALAYLFKYDSTYGVFAGEVGHDDDGIIVNGRHIAVTRCKAGEWEWERLGVTLAVETTGTIKDREGLSRHLDCGAKKVVISAPGKGVDAMIVMGVNQEQYDPAKHHIVSNASCTTNCLAPVALVLQREFGIQIGNMVTIHSYTNDQRILDMAHKDLRRARAAACNIIPTSTGAAQAVAKVIPELKGKFSGYSLRVPTPTVSVVDFSGILEKQTDTETLLGKLKEAAEGYLKGVLEYNDKALVSMDFKGNPASSILESSYTTVQDGRMVKAVAWYDNEWGYSNRVCDLVCLMQDKGL